MLKIQWVLLSAVLLLAALGSKATAQDKYKDAKAEQEAYRKVLQAIQEQMELDQLRKYIEKLSQGLHQRERELGIGSKEKKPESLEAKVDRLLDAVADLKKEVSAIKARLDGKQPMRDIEKKKEAKKNDIDFLLDELERRLERESTFELRSERQTAQQKAQQAAERAELERRLGQLMQEAEAIRRAIEKAKSK